ncbi:general substrate transporter [Dactylonectria estremocensis]|uniref:General substrate transporter n=1 Tax=Dactylonectria estremocensis TaxID=1079267 RepID=A0A9P9J066_9HYPO|nr:general substrate transporter [Dactylonectria estremocensis]
MATRKLSRFVPRDQKWLVACLIALSVVDSVLVGFDSSLMGSLNVMPTYSQYFTLTTTTKSLNTAISYVGGAVVSPFAGLLVDWRGRKESIYWSALLTLIGGVIQGSSQNIAMFIAGRCIVGGGMGLAQTAAPTLVAETTPVQYRGFALGMYYACWGVGTLLAAGVCYGTQNLDSTYAWRIPSLLQAAPSLVCFLMLQFVPESPRWLIGQDRHEEALEILSVLNGGELEEVQVQYREIADTIAFEKDHTVSVFHAVSKKSNRKRLLLTSTFSAIVMLPGTNIITFYFGDMLLGAGIKNPDTQLQINVILASWTLVVAVVSSWYADWLGRKWLCSASLALQTTLLLLFGGLTKLYGESSNTSGIYGTIAIIFLYNAAYGWGITPLTVLYPPEVLSFDIRGIGMGIYTFTTKCCGLLAAMAVPFGLQAIGWKFYMVNGCFNVLMMIFVLVFWVETRGLTLEEVDDLFDKGKRARVVEHAKDGREVEIVYNEEAKGAC